MHPVFQIELLGTFHIIYDDIPVIVNSTRLQSLLAYLLIHDHAPQPRRQIAFLLWPDSSESQAYTNLRRELHHLRRVLPVIDHFLEIDNAFVRWRRDAPFTLDLMNFKRLLAEAKAVGNTNPSTPKRHLLQQAVDCYRGPLLPDCYDEWILPLREELESLFVHALEQLVALLEEQRDYPAAIRAAERLLHHDRLLESAYRRLMRLHALNQDRARALRVYHDCCAILEQELGVEPAAETQMVYAHLLQAEESMPVRAGKTPSLVATTALVGRQYAWHALLTAYRTASSGHARMVLILGEAGIGKSRLAEELLLWAEQQGILTAKTRAYMAQGSLAYAPIVEILRTEALHTHWSKLADVWLAELLWLLPELQETHPELPPAPSQVEHWRRRRLMEALTRAILADDEPRVVLIDDLQWCDQETLDLLQYLLNFAPRARLLLVGTARPEEITSDHPLTALRRNLHREEQLTEIEIGPLTAVETTSLAAQVASGELNAEMVAQLYQLTEGNPLFIVETVRAGVMKTLLDSTAQPSSDSVAQSGSSSSPKIYAVIQSRLAQLSPSAQKLVSYAATIGRSFTFDMLVEASGGNEEEIVHSLDELWQRRIIRAQGINAYDFSHDRIRDVAYAAISPVRLPQVHRRIAMALEKLYADDLDAVASQLAVHYEQAGLVERAIDWHQRAAEVHRRLHAAKDDVKHLYSGLALLARLPDSPMQTQQEVSLLLTLSDSLMIAEGLASTGRLQALSRARELLHKVGDQRQLFHVVHRLHSFHIASHGVHVTHELNKELLQIAQERDDQFLLLIALFAQSGTHFALGEFADAFAKRQQAISLYQVATVTGRPAQPFEADLARESYLRSIAITLVMLGYADQARAYMAEAFEIAEEQMSPFSIHASLFLASLLYRIIEDIDKVQAFGERMLTVGTQYEVPLSIWDGTYCRGWILARQSDLASGIALIEQAVDGFRQVGHTMYYTYRLGTLADLYMQVNRLEAAEAALQEALAISEEAHERMWDAELQRLCGNLAQARGEPEATVEHYYLRSLEIARSQQAKSLELRAATSLARLWSKQGMHKKAHTILSETLNWFTEGFDTVDLRSATALLNELTLVQDT